MISIFRSASFRNLRGRGVLREEYLDLQRSDEPSIGSDHPQENDGSMPASWSGQRLASMASGDYQSDVLVESDLEHRRLDHRNPPATSSLRSARRKELRRGISSAKVALDWTLRHSSLQDPSQDRARIEVLRAGCFHSLLGLQASSRAPRPLQQLVSVYSLRLSGVGCLVWRLGRLALLAPRARTLVHLERRGESASAAVFSAIKREPAPGEYIRLVYVSSRVAVVPGRSTE